MADMKKALEKQIEVLEQVQAKALEEGDLKKAQEISHSVISIVNTINSLK